ncbi:amidophosphoribosyltransferase [Candidatus Woesearchaeota archaeon]|nr:amidophosphoribosyltransferase [Candidatus Woesearchaeota archaeon]
MGGLFGIVSKKDCVKDLFYGTDYHSHLGTMRGGLAVRNSDGIVRFIHDITNAQFRSKFEDDIQKMHGNKGIGVISDYEDQPLIIGSHLGVYSIVTVGKIANLEELAKKAFKKRKIHFAEMSGGEINPTELVATLINEQANFEDGIQYSQEAIEGSCSLILLTEKGIYVARDKLGRTPIIIGKKQGAYAATLETCAFPNLGFETGKYLGPGEIVLITEEGVEQKKKPRDKMQICSFLWVYYGYPASGYEGINVEATRYRCGAALARNDNIPIDIVAGIPDSGIAHGLGYANEKKIPFERPFVKYTPTWPRSFMPQNQEKRNEVAKMKLIPIRELIHGKGLLFCEDSIVRSTQLQDTIDRLIKAGVKEVHMRPSCPPLVYGCEYLNFSRSRSVMDLAARKAIKKLERREDLAREELEAYSNPDSEKFKVMIDKIRETLGLTSLKYQKLSDLVAAIGLPKEKLCTHCWDGSSYS